MPVARDIERDVHPLRRRDSRIDFVLQPVLRNLLLDHMHVPRVLCAKIPAAPGDSKSALGSAGAEGTVRTADRAAFSKRNLIILFLGRSLRLLFGRRLLLLLAALSLHSCPESRSHPASFSSILGCDCVMPFDSLASTFWVCAGFAGNGTVLTSVAPIASPPPPAPQVSPLGSRHQGRVDQHRHRDAHVQARRPRQRAAPAVVLEVNLSVCCHFAREVASRCSRS